MALGWEAGVSVESGEGVDGFAGEGEDGGMGEVEYFERFLWSSGPCWDGATVEVEEEVNEPAVDGVEDVVMARDFDGIFWLGCCLL